MAAAWVAVTALLAAKLAGETVDDFFITFRYSQNLLAGEGFVFNPGERVFGTTAPGWGLLLAGLARATGLAPAVAATFATALALLLTAGWILRQSAAQGRFGEAALAGSMMLTSSFLWVHNGSEAFTAMAVMVVAAGLGRERPAVAGGLAGFAVWLRPEAGLAGLLLGSLLATDALRKAAPRDRRLVLRYAASFAAVVGVGLVWAASYFGQALPNTLHAKQLQAAWNPATWPSGGAFWQEGWKWLSSSYAGPFIGILVIGGGAGLVSLLRSGQRALQLLVLYALALFAAYPLLGVPFYTWYAIPLLIVLLYGVAFLTGDLWRLCRRLPAPAGIVAGLLVLVPVALLTFHAGRRTLAGYRGFEAIPQTELYRVAGRWLAQSSPPQADVAYVEVGALAYYSERPVRDLLGLVSPENLAFVEAHDLAAALRARPTAYVVHHTRLAGMMDPIVRQPWFGESYEPAATFEAKLSSDVLTLYRRRNLD